jgi:hypothetical protein
MSGPLIAMAGNPKRLGEVSDAAPKIRIASPLLRRRGGLVHGVNGKIGFSGSSDYPTRTW